MDVSGIKRNKSEMRCSFEEVFAVKLTMLMLSSWIGLFPDNTEHPKWEIKQRGAHKPFWRWWFPKRSGFSFNWHDLSHSDALDPQKSTDPTSAAEYFQLQ